MVWTLVVIKMPRNRDLEAGLCVLVADELSSVSHWCCFFCALFTFTHGALCCGFLSVNIVLGIPITNLFPIFEVIISRLESFGNGEELFYFYLLISNVVISFPFGWIASMGAKNFVSLVISIIFAVFSSLEYLSYLSLALIKSPENKEQWICILILLLVSLVTLFLVVLALNVRQRQRRALHTAKLIQNKKRDSPVLVPPSTN